MPISLAELVKPADSKDGSYGGTKLKVLHIYRTYYPDTQGGLEEVIRQICINSKSLGVESRVLTLTNDAERKVVRLPEAVVYRAKLSFEIASCGVSFQAPIFLRRLIEWADIVHYHFPWPYADFLHFFVGVKKPSILTYHSDIVRQRYLLKLYEPLMHKFLSSVDKIVCTSPNYFATSDVLSKFAPKVDVVPIGVDDGLYTGTPDTALSEVRERYGEDFFLFVGVLRYYKGLHILLNAVKDKPYKVVIAGSGPTERELERQSRELGLENVVFAGKVTNTQKNALFELCRGVVFPSYLRTEAFGVTLLEGALFGKPLISTEVGSGTSHVNVHGETGIVVPPGSPRALGAAMDELWRNPSRAHKLGRGARERYEKLFTGQLMGARYTELYRQLVPPEKAIVSKVD